MNETINVIAGLLRLAQSGTFNCDLDGADKIADLRRRANTELTRLVEAENEDVPVLTPEETDNE
jgi:hypothetical protein